MTSNPRPVALITGASAGLGFEYSHLFAADGYDLVLVARREDKLRALANELREKYGTVSTLCAVDLADPRAPATVFERCKEQGVFVEALVNNAGLGGTGRISEIPLDAQLRQIHVNVTALTALTALFLPAMLERRRGRILNVSSTAGFQAGPFMAVYFATKAYVNSFTEALAYETRGTGVTATVHCPGATATEFAQVAGNEKTKLFQRSWGIADAKSVASDGYKAMMAGKVMKVHGLANKIGVVGTRLVPRRAAAALSAQMNRA